MPQRIRVRTERSRGRAPAHKSQPTPSDIPAATVITTQLTIEYRFGQYANVNGLSGPISAASIARGGVVAASVEGARQQPDAHAPCQSHRDNRRRG